MKELEMWLVRDKNNNLCLYDGKSKPFKRYQTRQQGLQP